MENFLTGKLNMNEALYTEEDAVVQITSTTFSDVVYDKEKDVFVEFYAPWDGHCNAFAPSYKRLASIMRLLPSVVIGAYDVQASAPPEKYNITSLPTMLYFPANDKDDAIPYGGFQEINSIVEFILDHQTTADETAVTQFKEIFSQISQQPTDEDEDEEIIDFDNDEENKDEL